ncbi:hypothetical protein GXW74_00375 [Roseomonas eburnea]|uniref:Uncharacterized protein n=1 Tax=Neoroseomonas eburnea TaxID=1346889 RepID=A0A9X9X5E4_9PROT|nr:hypothetical protein [Neoroseomonas eburnea]MBR0678930.1 hypothetical protein [Neoroseomonas eburnea]
MILRTIALLFFSLAAVMGFALGWGYELGAALFRVNPGALNALQAGIQRYLFPEVWDGAFVPILAMPAWGLPVLLGLVFLAISLARAGRG